MQQQPTSLTVLNLAMLVGITPLWLTCLNVWLTADQYHSQGAGIVEMFAAMYSYGFAAVVGGIAALWSISVSRKINQQAGRFTSTMRFTVAVTLVVPWFILGSL